MLKKEVIADLMKLYPSNLETMTDGSPDMYIDWNFYNWGNPKSPIEELKVTISLDLETAEVSKYMSFVDTIGNYYDVPLDKKDSCDKWASEQTNDLVEKIKSLTGRIIS